RLRRQAVPGPGAGRGRAAAGARPAGDGAGMSDTVRVLVVDDSPFTCRLIASYLGAEPGVKVVGTAHDGPTALERVRELAPDVVTLDLEMPGMHGLAVLDRVMHDHPTPVVLLSGVSRRAAAVTLEALDRGAVDFVLKYSPHAPAEPEALRREVVAK